MVSPTEAALLSTDLTISSVQMFDGGWFITRTEHIAVFVCKPDVTDIWAFFVPAVLYVFWTDCVIPESPSVPDQEYAKLPIPPNTLAVHTTGVPVVVCDGEPE